MTLRSRPGISKTYLIGELYKITKTKSKSKYVYNKKQRKRCDFQR